jgi:hypothetical protein
MPTAEASLEHESNYNKNNQAGVMMGSTISVPSEDAEDGRFGDNNKKPTAAPTEVLGTWRQGDFQANQYVILSLLERFS